MHYKNNAIMSICNYRENNYNANVFNFFYQQQEKKNINGV